MRFNVSRIFSRDSGRCMGLRFVIRCDAYLRFVRAILSELLRLTHASRCSVEQYVRPDRSQASIFPFSVRTTGAEHRVHEVCRGVGMVREGYHRLTM